MELFSNEADLFHRLKNEGCDDLEKAIRTSEFVGKKYAEMCSEMECLSGRMTGMCHIVIGLKQEMKVQIEYTLGEIRELKKDHEQKIDDMRMRYEQRFSELQLENEHVHSINRQLIDNIDDRLQVMCKDRIVGDGSCLELAEGHSSGKVSLMKVDASSSSQLIETYREELVLKGSDEVTRIGNSELHFGELDLLCSSVVEMEEKENRIVRCEDHRGIREDCSLKEDQMDQNNSIQSSWDSEVIEHQFQSGLSLPRQLDLGTGHGVIQGDMDYKEFPDKVRFTELDVNLNEAESLCGASDEAIVLCSSVKVREDSGELRILHEGKYGIKEDHPSLDQMVQRADSSLIGDSEVFGLSFIRGSEAINLDCEGSIYVVEQLERSQRGINKSDRDQWVPNNDNRSKQCEEDDQSFTKLEGMLDRLLGGMTGKKEGRNSTHTSNTLANPDTGSHSSLHLSLYEGCCKIDREGYVAEESSNFY